MRKGLLILIDSLLLVLIVFAGYQLFQVLQGRAIATFNEKQQTTLASKMPSIKQEGNIGHHHVTAYLPAAEEGEAIEPVRAAMLALIEKEFGTENPSGQIEELGYVWAESSTSDFTGVTAVQLHYSRYGISKLKIKEKESGQGEKLLLTSQHKRFGMTDLFPSLDQAKAFYAAQLQEELTAQAVAADRQTTYLTNFASFDFASADFSYKESRISIDTKGVDVGQDSLTVPVSELFEVVDTQYLTESDQAAYKKYQEEKAAAEAAERAKNAKRIALTFDDGPRADTTPQALDILKKYGAKATFFVVGNAITGNEAILQRMLAEGHEIGNHSYDHPNLTILSAAEVSSQIQLTQDAVFAATGQRPTVVRPPYGAINQSVMSVINMPAINWSVDTLDWKTHNTAAILSEVKAQTGNGGIILMHDIHQTTIDALPTVLDYLKKEGYEFVTVSELIGDNPNPHMVYYSRDYVAPAP